ncbi:hypothetical protein BSKO_07907 [Bryopsis sp. KO-2023]|nr:hypothetical protein BSKO_07907 [Bryopsis sp. KO-2023]
MLLSGSGKRCLLLSQDPHVSRPNAPKRGGRRPLRAVRLDSDTIDLLDSFWKARGVFDQGQRQKLVGVASEMEGLEGDALGETDVSPGLSYTWAVQAYTPQIIAVSRRLIQLRELLGGQADIDIVWMCVREPRLLTLPYSSLLKRLMDMKLSNSGDVADILRVVERQPALLIQDDTQVDLEEKPEEQLPAWEFGLVSDKEGEWSKRFAEIRDYEQIHGDAHVGFREGDCLELDRWCEKQRGEESRGTLEPSKRKLLEQVGFEFDRDDAEWMRWYTELKAYQRDTGAVTPMALASGMNFFLINWCSVQRVAKRTGVLSKVRRDLLDDVEFNWAAADALS